ncbi:MAG: ABC transporter permease subunit [Oscillospiraceae bacterium]|nr:ABC transporter permease subunit [Oscillospiraceae bacterium]
MKTKLFNRLGAALYLALGLLPFAAFAGGGGDVSLILPDPRRTGLLCNSVLLGGLTAALCTGLGFAVAQWIRGSRLRQSPLRFFFLLLAPMPQYIYALSWMQLIRLLGQFWPGAYRLFASGLLPCVAVESLGFLPLCTALALIGLESQDRAEVEAALLCRNGAGALYHILLPGALPLLLSGAGCVFALSITDFSVPSLFQYNVYAIELFSEYSAAGAAQNAFWLAAPLLLLAVLAVAGTQAGISGFSFPQRSGDLALFRLPLFPRIMSWIGGAACLIQLVIPFCTLAVTAGPSGIFVQSLALSAEEFGNSLLVAALAASMALLPAFAAGRFLASRRGGWWTLFLLPLASPGALVGIGLLSLVNGSCLQELLTGALLPALGCAVRFMPFALLIAAAAFRRLDRERLEAGALLQRRCGACFFHVLLPMLAPYLCAAWVAVAMFSLGETGAGLILAPPGLELLSVKIFNYLHYGASELVSGFCLAQAALTAAALGLTLLWTAGRKG